jgi:hypothetical protein
VPGPEDVLTLSRARTHLAARTNFLSGMGLSGIGKGIHRLATSQIQGAVQDAGWGMEASMNGRTLFDGPSSVRFSSVELEGDDSPVQPGRAIRDGWACNCAARRDGKAVAPGAASVSIFPVARLGGPRCEVPSGCFPHHKIDFGRLMPGNGWFTCTFRLPSQQRTVVPIRNRASPTHAPAPPSANA